MNTSAPANLVQFLASRPATVIKGDLYTFALTSGPVFRFTNQRVPVTVAGNTYLPGPPRIDRGKIKLERGYAIDSHKITLYENNGTFLQMMRDGYFNLAQYTLQRVYSAAPGAPWLGPVTRFSGQIGSIDEVGLSYGKMTAKSALNLLNNDFPRVLMQQDCPNVLFDLGFAPGSANGGCGLKRQDYQVNGTVLAGSTGNTILSGLTQAAGYFNQGVITFTSGVLDGFSYMVKNHLANGTLYPAYVLLATPAAGDTFIVSPGCDKTLATCKGKFGYSPASGQAPFFRGTPFVPDPVLSY